MKYPNLMFEKRLWKKNYLLVAGLDEVGRGAFSGPVVAGCVVFDKYITKKLKNIKTKKYTTSELRNSLTTFNKNSVVINESKKLSDKKRRIADRWIKENCISWGIGEASVAEINKYGISKASASAFRRAIAGANIRMHTCIQYILIDAFFVPYTRGLPVNYRYRDITDKYSKKSKNIRMGDRQTAIVRGDEKSLSIAAASIVAKVYRDDLMIRLGSKNRYRKYEWENNKGYGTLYHRDTLTKHGLTRHHRKKYVIKYI